MQPQHRSFLALNPHGFHRIAFTEWGDPRERHVVVCVHGLTRNSHDFDVLAASLASGCRVVCMDVAGRGASDWLDNKQDYGFPQYLSDAAALLALVTDRIRMGEAAQPLRRLRRKQEPPVIDWIGTSMGGLIGMMLASKPSSPLRRLVLNDVGPFISWQALGDLKKVYSGGSARLETMDEVEDYLRKACADFGPLPDEQWKQVARHSVEASPEGGYVLAWDPGIASSMRANGNHQGIEYGSDFFFGVDFWPMWNAVTCPTLVLRGEKSALLTAATAEQMRGSGPNAQVVELPGIGHAPWLMSEDQIGIIADFLFAA